MDDSRTGSTMCATSPTTKTVAGRLRHLPRNLACLTNVAIAIVRCDGRFRYLPEANRYAARARRPSTRS